MPNNYEKILNSLPNVVNMLKGISKDLWYIFLPASAEHLHQLELQIVANKLNENKRNQVMAIQLLCGLPLRPNEPLRETQAKAHLQGHRRGKLFDKFKKKKKNDDDNPSGHFDA